MNKTCINKPKKLTTGSTIGIISPAGPVDDSEQWDKVSKYFISKGYNVKIAPHARDKNGYLAGNDEDRAKDLTEFFLDKNIDAIICARGGYGTYRILDYLDFNIVKKNPKIFIGYSDITALINTFTDKSNLVTFHGPLATPDFGADEISEFTESHFWNIVENKENIPLSLPNIPNYQCINSGEASGILAGGNLTVLVGLLGTPYFPDLTNKILLLEDVGEPLYKIDRLLMQLKLAGVFNKLSGLIFGDFTSIIQSDLQKINELTPICIIKQICSGLNIPIGYGFPASHHNKKLTLPLGVNYYFRSDDFKFNLEEEYLTN